MSWIKLEKRNALRHTVAGRIPLCSRSRAKQQKCSVRLRAGPCAGKAALLPSPPRQGCRDGHVGSRDFLCPK